ncbi:tRNA pseudouridine synthase A [Pseudoclavibacter triregionum]|nr:tRNA pseudouridine synthase A [Pseudoclavibacter triregionum]
MADTIRLRIGVAYDGTALSGWAAQPGLRTVQGVLEDALRILYRGLPDGPLLTCAGRTDAGVHALGQVCHLDLDVETWEATVRRDSGADPASHFVRRMTGILGPDSDVVVASCEPAPEGFDARFSATWRRYEYRLADAAAPPNPLERHRTARVQQALDLDVMQAAADRLIGLHDFAGFCKPRPHATTIRTLQEFAWRRADDGVLVARLVADAFCHSMVRSLVGMCAAAGSGRLPLAKVDELLEAEERGRGFAVLPSRGLTLMEVGYPDAEELATRQELTRAKRRSLRLVGGTASGLEPVGAAPAPIDPLAPPPGDPEPA